MSQGENIAVVVGYVTTPELSRASNGAAVLKFRVAANEWVGSGDKRRQCTDWIPVCVWGNYAEALGKNLSKGQLVSVSGKLRAWRGRDGTTCFHVESESTKRRAAADSTYSRSWTGTYRRVASDFAGWDIEEPQVGQECGADAENRESCDFPREPGNARQT